MKVEDIKTVSVIGAGLMGSGIAQVFALGGYDVIMKDVHQELLDNALVRIKENIQKRRTVGLVPEEDMTGLFTRLKTTLVMEEAVAKSDFMIEAAIENLDIKKQIFREADKFSPERTILATNTSALPIAEIAGETNRPGKVVGTHFWNPPHLLRAVEVVRGSATTGETVNLTRDLLTRVGKKPVVVNKDVPGQIGIRVLYAMLREAMSLVEKGVASPEDIDTVVKEALGTRLPVVGVLELADLSGVDLVLTVSKRLFRDLDNNPQPSKFLESMVANGRTGIKSGKGFYNWTQESIASTIKRRDEHLLKILNEGTE